MNLTQTQTQIQYQTTDPKPQTQIQSHRTNSLLGCINTLLCRWGLSLVVMTGVVNFMSQVWFSLKGVYFFFLWEVCFLLYVRLVIVNDVLSMLSSLCKTCLWVCFFLLVVRFDWFFVVRFDWFFDILIVNDVLYEILLYSSMWGFK